MQIKILQSSDIDLFDEFINKFDSISDSENTAWQWYRSLLSEDRYGVIIAATIVDEKLETVFCSFAVDMLYQHRYPIIPFWVAGLIRSVKIGNSIPSVKIDELAAPVALKYEKFGFKNFYVVRDIPVTVGYHNIDRYIEKVQNKNFLTPRYHARLDRFIDNPQIYTGFDMFKLMIPKHILPNRKIAIFRYDLKYQFYQTANNK